MIAMIERLIARGHAYRRARAMCCSRVASYQDYGKLSRRSRKEMIAGARVEVAPYKRRPRPISCCGSRRAADQPGWDSPWGRGRPGWHIECSAMSEAHLGRHFDIHGGGDRPDLPAPRERGRAKRRARMAASPSCDFWVHNGFLSVDSTKMSKSLGNFVTVHEVLDEWRRRGDPAGAAVGALPRPARLDRAAAAPGEADPRPLLPRAGPVARPVFERFGEADEALRPVKEALEDDLNTPLAVTRLHAARRCDQPHELRRRAFGAATGARRGRPADGVARTGSARLAARQQRGRRAPDRGAHRAACYGPRPAPFCRGRQIRAALAADGILLEDRPDGTTTWWRKD